MAKGHNSGRSPDKVRIAVTLPRAHFEYIRDMAVSKKKAISDVIAEYVATGIIVDNDIKEWDERQKARDEQKAAS